VTKLLAGLKTSARDAWRRMQKIGFTGRGLIARRKDTLSARKVIKESDSCETPFFLSESGSLETTTSTTTTTTTTRKPDAIWHEQVSFDGSGYIELDSKLVSHEPDYRLGIELSLSTVKSQGLLLWQGRRTTKEDYFDGLVVDEADYMALGVQV